MKLRNFTSLLGTLAVGLFSANIASASTMVGAGQFNLSGTVYVTQTQFQFGYLTMPPAGDQKAGVLLPADGPFSGLKAGEIASIGNLLTPAAGGPVTPGTPFLLSNWIQLGNGVDINADLTNIAVNMNIPVCAGGSAEDMPGYTCRASAASPVVLEQGFSGVTALLNVAGQAHYAGSSVESPLIGHLSANFTFGADSTISGLLNDFNTNGFIETGYSGNFSTTASALTPEPASLALFGMGIIGFGLFAKKKLAK